MAFRTRVLVRFSDIDPAGVVYFPRFLHYCHTAMEDFFADELGVSYARLFAEHRCGFPAVHLETDFRRPLRYGETVEIEVEIVKVGRTSVTWRYTLRGGRAGDPAPEIAAEVEIVTACIDLDRFRARVVPDWLVEAFSARLAAAPATAQGDGLR